MNKARESIENMAVPFEGNNPEISREEQKQAADVFKGMCEDMFLSHMEYAIINPKSQDRIPYYMYDQSSLFMNLPAEDGSSLSIVLYSANIEQADYNHPFEISVQVQDEQGYGRHYSGYEMARDGSAVKRKDIDDLSEKNKQTPDFLQMINLDENISIDEILSRSVKAIEYYRNEMQNTELERKMGLNNQPVGLSEINTLAELVRNATPYRLR